jgi:hypothetical protein
LKRVSSKGAKRAKFRVLNSIASIVEETYGIANFSIGLAKESNLK